MDDPIDILLVDDESRNLDALESILDGPAYRLLRAQGADTALKLLLDHAVAAIVLDIKMPGVSGFELAQLIQGTKRFRQIPIILLTAYHLDDKDVLAGYGSGAVDYLTKPVNPLILRHKVGVFADLFRKTRALAELNEKLEARVAERTAELEHASRMKDEFLATISHELRTPLNAIMGWATLLRQERVDASRTQHGLEIIERNAKAQARIITDLLDVSRIITGKLHLTMQKFPLEKAVQGALDVVRHAAEAKGVTLTSQADPAVGMTVGDPGRMQQVVWNLLANAIRHTPQGGRVSVGLQREGAMNVIRVEDTGAGIAAEHLPHIFERFRQVDSSITRSHGGLGLGLAIVRHLVEAHGGTVEAASEGAGQGARFTITLPVRAVDVEPDTAATDGEQSKAVRWRAQLAGLHILVVEDDPDSLELVRAVLEHAGASATPALSAREALAALERGSFDAIVSDIGMPDLDGYAFLQRARTLETARAVPAIALTAYARPEDVERAAKSGYGDHLSKPVEAWKLIEAIRTLVHRPVDAA